jgi:hypothetical protein
VPEVGTLEPIDTVSVAGVVPLPGLTINQLLVEEADTVKFSCPIEDVTNSCWEEAEAPLKVSCEGDAANELLCARAVSIEHNRAGTRTARANQEFWRVFTVFSKQS